MSNQYAPFGIRVIALTVAILLTALLLPGISTDANILQIVGLAIVLALFNLIARPILLFLSIPLLVITLGLFLLVINALMLSWSAELTGWLQIDSFWAALLGGAIISLVSTWVQTKIVGPQDDTSSLKTSDLD